MIARRGRDLATLLVLGLLAYVIYSRHEMGRDVERICELVGFHGLASSSTASDREEIDAVCARHQAAE